MALSDPLTTIVRVSEGVPLGGEMKKIRLWLNTQKIHPAAFMTAADARGYTFTIKFTTVEEAYLFRHQFAA